MQKIKIFLVVKQISLRYTEKLVKRDLEEV